MQECLDQNDEKTRELFDQITKEFQEELKQCRANYKNDREQHLACDSKARKERVRKNHATKSLDDKARMDCVARFQRK